jgi:hypothetical protein
MDKAETLTALQKGTVELQGQFLPGSNYTFLVTLNWKGQEMAAVYKPAKGERPLFDFPPQTLAKREVAAYVVSDALGWELVPWTVYRHRKLPLGAGSVQQFVAHNPNEHYFTFSEDLKQKLQPVALYDLLVNNADRKGGHILLRPEGGFVLIDHGICFHYEYKLRTVVWDFAGEEIPRGLQADMRYFLDELADEGEVFRQLRKLLQLSEIAALLNRGRELLKSGLFPLPLPGKRSYPWPLI